MSIIGEETNKAIKESVGELLDIYNKPINEAYADHEDFMTLNISVRLSPSKNGGTDVLTAMQFSMGKIKDQVRKTVDENQMELFQMEGEGAK